MFFSPSPSMSKAPRDTKWRSRSTACAGQVSPPVQRRIASPSGRVAIEPQTGQCVGNTNRLASAGRFSGIDVTICGITSPARWTTTVSPLRTSLRSISSSLCSVARATITPPTLTGSSSATGVRAPVRPTWITMSRSFVRACSAANLCAMAQRGLRATKPRRFCRSNRSTL